MRTEYYNDKHETNVVTNTTNGFQVISASVNFDHQIEENALWRTEIRGFHSKDEVFPQGADNKNRNSGLIVTSLALWF